MIASCARIAQNGVMKFRFLNVDLEVVSPRKLDALVKELGDQVMVLHSGPPPKKRRGYFVSMEICGVRSSRNPNVIIHGLCALIEKLSPAGRRLRDDAEKALMLAARFLPKTSASNLRCDLTPFNASRRSGRHWQ